MKSEQQTHDFAIEIIKMWYDANKEHLEIDSDKNKIIPTDKLAEIYSSAYGLIANG